MPATQEPQVREDSTDPSLPPPFRDLPDEPAPGERPAVIYPDCPYCEAYVTPNEDTPPTCVACLMTPFGELVADENETEVAWDPAIGPRRDEERPTYRNSGLVRLNGGFEYAYPDEQTQTERDAELDLFDTET